MAPVYPACRLPRLPCLSQFGVPVVPVHLVSVLFVMCMVLHWYHVVSVLTYDHQSLLNIQSRIGTHRGFCPALHSRFQSPFSQPVVECARRLPC